jgi:transposase-like protein
MHKEQTAVLAQRAAVLEVRQQLEEQTHALDEKMLQFVEAGGSVINLAKMLGITRSRVYVVLHRARERREQAA